MKKIYSLFLFALFFSSCEVIPKAEISHSGSPGKISYSRTVETSLKKEENYDNIVKVIFVNYPKAKLITDEKATGIMEVTLYGMYLYRGDERKFTCMMEGNFTDKSCTLTILNVHILQKSLESFYFDDRRKIIKKLNPSYIDLNKRLNIMIEDFAKQLK